MAEPAFAYDFKGRPIYDKVGFVTPPDPQSRQPIKPKVAIPMRPHFGVMGVAKAMRQSADQMLDFLTTKRKMSADETYSLISVGVDFGVTQIVDIRQGCHAAVPKRLFVPT